MRKDPILCPSCGAKFDVETIFRPRRSRAPVDEPAPKPAAPAPAADGEDIDKELAALADDSVVDDDDDDAAIEDTSDLADDDSDVPVVPKDINDET
jgi:hypothetical protein